MMIDLTDNNSNWGQFIDLEDRIDRLERGNVMKVIPLTNYSNVYENTKNPDYYLVDDYNFSYISSLENIPIANSISLEDISKDLSNEVDSYPSHQYTGFVVACYWGDKLVKTGFVVWLVYALFM